MAHELSAYGYAQGVADENWMAVMSVSDGVLGRGSESARGPLKKARSARKPEPNRAHRGAAKAKAAKPKGASPKKVSESKSQGATLPILYMLSPQKFMSPFDCNMAADAGYKIVLPYDNVTVPDVQALVQDAIFSRPPKSRTGFFLGGKDIHMALEMMASAKRAMVPPFEVSLFADPGGSFTTAAAMVACTERQLRRNFRRGLSGTKIAVFGATGVVGFASAVIAALEGANVRIVAHDTLEPLRQSAALAFDRFGAKLEPVAGQTEPLKAKLVRDTDVIFTAGPAGVNIISRQMISRAPNLLIAADVNAVPPMGIEGMELFMDGAPLPGCSTLGIGALAIGDVKYKTQAGLFKRMLSTADALELDFRHAFQLAREIASKA